MSAVPNVVYIDALIALAVLSFGMDFLPLWASAKVTRVHRPIYRLACGSLIGTAYFLVFYLSRLGAIPYYGWLQYWPTVLFSSIAVVVVAFYPVSWRQLVRVTGFFYLIAISSGGAGFAAGYALGWGVLGRLLVAIAAILIIAELGWGVVQKSLWQRIYHVPLDISLFGDRVSVLALIDTGNRLKDPLKGSPVIVLEHSAIARLLPDHLRDSLLRLERGDLSEISRLLTSSRLSSRFRIIPFASLGTDNGLLIGFRPDEASIVADGRRVVLKDVVVGISPTDLDRDGAYRALINPELLQSALETGGAAAHSTPGNEGESAHVTSVG